MLFYILSLSRLRSICRGLACYSVSYHPWQYPPRLGMLITHWQYPTRLGMLFYNNNRICILSRLGSIRRGLACYSISYHGLAVSAEAWHAILYLITAWQYPPRFAILYLITPRQHLPRLGMQFYILSRLGSIRRGLACYSISALAVSAEAWHAILYLRSSS